MRIAIAMIRPVILLNTIRITSPMTTYIASILSAIPIYIGISRNRPCQKKYRSCENHCC